MKWIFLGLVKVNFRPLSAPTPVHVEPPHATKGGITETSLWFQRHNFNHLSWRISVHTLDNLPWPIQIPPFHFENYTRRQLWSCEAFPTRNHVLRLWGTEQFDLVAGIRVKRVNKAHRHGVPSPHVWLNDHFPARFTSQQISFHDHFSLFSLSCLTGSF